jgi:hypothetical protein
MEFGIAPHTQPTQEMTSDINKLVKLGREASPAERKSLSKLKTSMMNHNGVGEVSSFVKVKATCCGMI